MQKEIRWIWYQIVYPEAEGGRAWVLVAFIDVLGDVGGVPQAEAGPLPPPTPTPPLPYPGKLVFQVANGGDIWVVNVDGSGLRKLTTGMDPAWSPNGSEVAFVRWGGPQTGLYVINADSRGERQVFGGPEFKALTWSPDSQWIAFFSDRRGEGELWVMRADGSEQRPMFADGLPGVEFGPYDFAHERIVSWGP